jgi:hypothetical protein
MGTVFKKTATKPLPAGAKIIVRKGERLAEWIDAKDKRRTAPVTTGKDGPSPHFWYSVEQGRGGTAKDASGNEAWQYRLDHEHLHRS